MSYYADPLAQLIQGDCLEVMAGMEENSVDAIVTDPPFLLGFMGKEWDKGGQDFHRGWAEQAYRVLKPGGHMLVAGIGRTHHRMMCGVEDAGFEVRDCIYHFFGQGFPKSSRVNRAPRFCQCAVAEHNESSIDHEQEQGDRIDMEPVAGDDVPRKTDARHSRRKAEDSQGDCQPNLGLYDESAPPDLAGGLTPAPSPEYVLGHSHSAEPLDALACGSSHSPSQAQYSDPPSNRDSFLPDLAIAPVQPDTQENMQQRNKRGWDDGSQDDHRQNMDGFPLDVLPSGAPPTHEFSTGFPRCQMCGKPIANGWGTALKPAAEVWVLFRKPLSECNVALNVQRWGTGAINVDGTRVQSIVFDSERRTSLTGHSQIFPFLLPQDGERHNPAGRWPPNVVFTHLPPDSDGNGGCEMVGEKRVKGNGAFPERIQGASPISFRGNEVRPARIPLGDPDGLETVPDWRCVEGCAVLALDQQVGNRPGSHDQTATQSNNSLFGVGINTGQGYGDNGSPSRFFPQFAWEEADFWPFKYVAKAGRAEREWGVVGGRRFLATMGDGIGGREHNTDETSAWVANNHPTIKPLALMRWLITLVTPPGGLVLDPFAGSGSTLVAAKQLAFRSIGIEQLNDAEHPYCEIAKGRIIAAQPGLLL